MPGLCSSAAHLGATLLSILRIMVGCSTRNRPRKNGGFPAPAEPRALRPVHLGSRAFKVYWSGGGLFLSLGLFTRPSLLSSRAHGGRYFMAHAREFFPLLNGGELAIVYCFVFLYFWLAGGR